MKYVSIYRRDFLRLSIGAGLLGLASCTKSSDRLILSTSSDIFPKELFSTLPSAWKVEDLRINSKLNPYEFIFNGESDLIALQDGWLSGVPPNELALLGTPTLYKSLGAKARDFLKAFENDYENKILPIGVSPWVMIFRNGDPWLKQWPKL